MTARTGWLVALALTACGGTRAPGPGQATPARTGAWVFETSGCASCHATPSCDATGAPPGRDLLGQDVALAFEVAARRLRDREPGSCRALGEFARRWASLREHIRAGNDSMPPWTERSHPELTGERDLELLVGFLASQHVPRATEQALVAAVESTASCHDHPASPALPQSSIATLLERELAPMTAAPYVEFESMESTLFELDETVFVNRISRHALAGLEVWFLQQRTLGADTGPFHSFAIAVDRRLVVPRAYFVSFSATGTATLEGDECFECHASGPRVIRPRAPKHVARSSAADLTTIAAWNRDLAAQGAIEAAWPQAGTAPEVRPLEVAACARCHAPDSALRRPLFATHLRPVMSALRSQAHGDGYNGKLTPCGRAVMPQGPALHADERAQLGAWIAAGCTQLGGETCAFYLRETPWAAFVTPSVGSPARSPHPADPSASAARSSGHRAPASGH